MIGAGKAGLVQAEGVFIIKNSVRFFMMESMLQIKQKWALTA
jgi:hypothetical protein